MPAERYSNRRRIHFIITGGTIDDIDLSKAGPVSEVELARNPHLYTSIPAMLENGGVTDFTWEAPFIKDSRVLIDEGDRTELLGLIRDSPSKRVVVTHGTYTLNKTFDFLLAHRREFKGKTVVLTGAFRPPSEANSDAQFALGMANATALTHKPGLYIALGGSVVAADSATRQRFNKFFSTVKSRF